MSYRPGDRVHLRGLGTGVVREARGSNRYAVDIKGRIVVAGGNDLETADAASRGNRRRRNDAVGTTAPGDEASGHGPALDLHGKTADEAREALETFVNAALLAGHHTVHVIHGRSGGRLKTVVHQYLRRVATVAAFRLDPRNPGVTIVTFT